MKWNFEPALISEAVRQLILMLVLFNTIHWSEQQIAAVLMVISAFLALFTRQSTVPLTTVHAAGTTADELKAVAKDPTATMTSVPLPPAGE